MLSFLEKTRDFLAIPSILAFPKKTSWFARKTGDLRSAESFATVCPHTAERQVQARPAWNFSSSGQYKLR
jgi:hypothetical protein